MSAGFGFAVEVRRSSSFVAHACTLTGVDLPEHVVSTRRDGRKEVLLHRSMAILSPGKVEITAARSTLILPLIGLALAAVAGSFLAARGTGLPFFVMVLLLLFCLMVVPVSVMGLIGSLVGAQVVVDQAKGSATWQQGALGMGIGAKDVVPFANIDHLEVTVEGDQPDRWKGESDTFRQFQVVLVKTNGRRLALTQVPVPSYDQSDGMDRTLAVANAVSAITGARIELPEGWHLVEIDTDTGEEVVAKVAARQRGRRKR